jgi:hypothetical protein
MTVAHNRPIALLKLPTKVPNLIAVAKSIVARMQGNPSFPQPLPSLQTVSAAIDALEAAEGEALSRSRGSAAVREEKRVALISLFELLRAYVQSVSDADIDNSAAIIENAGMSIKRNRGGSKRSFAVKHGIVSGALKLSVPVAAQRACYEWEMSTDGGKTWQPLPNTLKASTTVSGLQPGSTVAFRYRTLTKAGFSDWSQVVSIIVL